MKINLNTPDHLFPSFLKGENVMLSDHQLNQLKEDLDQVITLHHRIDLIYFQQQELRKNLDQVPPSLLAQIKQDQTPLSELLPIPDPILSIPEPTPQEPKKKRINRRSKLY